MSRRRREPTETPSREPLRPPTLPEPRAGTLHAEVVDSLGRSVTAEPELLERRRVVAALLALGVTRHQLVAALEDQGHVVTEYQARTDYETVMREWSAEYEVDRSHSRAVQVRRLQGDLARLRRDKKWGAVAAHERLLALIQGHMAPVKVAVDAHLTVRTNLVATIANMTPEELDALAAEQLELEGLAEQARRLPGG